MTVPLRLADGYATTAEAGFHPACWRMRYDTPDASGLARQVVGLLPEGGTSTAAAGWTTGRGCR